LIERSLNLNFCRCRLQSELVKLQKYKARLKGENEKYLENHPEMRPLLDEFMGAIFRDKPSDIVKFGALYFSSMRVQKPLGPSPLVVTGPPQIGKTTILRMLVEKYPGIFGYAVVHSTRKPREGEVDGVDHHFVDRAAYDALEADGEVVDTYVLQTSSYAISRRAIQQVSVAAASAFSSELTCPCFCSADSITRKDMYFRY
jgi:hypothetical protein